MSAATKAKPVAPNPEEQYESQAIAVREQSFSVTKITSAQELAESVDRSKQIAKGRSIIEAHLRPGIDDAHQLHKKLLAKLKELCLPLDEADNHESNIRSEYYKDNAEAGNATPKQQGLAVREKWSAEIVDFEALLKAAADNPKAYGKYLVPNEKLLDMEARNQKENFDVPGVKAQRDFSDAVRG